jgi:hypothetical protein
VLEAESEVFFVSFVWGIKGSGEDEDAIDCVGLESDYAWEDV